MKSHKMIRALAEFLGVVVEQGPYDDWRVTRFADAERLPATRGDVDALEAKVQALMDYLGLEVAKQNPLHVVPKEPRA